MRVRLLTILLSLLLSAAVAQEQKSTINGYVKDANTGENLIGATIIVRGSLTGTVTNTHGFFSITLPRDSVNLLFSYVGYGQYHARLYLRKDTLLQVELVNTSVLDEIVVNASRTDKIHEVTSMSSVSIPIDQIKTLPAFFGETDVLKVIQLLPGVQSGNEGSTGLYVRGGGPDQNLILLDGVPVYNASHLFGFFSIFNADALNHVELVKGGFPARYGGRLSSVIDINMRNGDMKKIKGEGSIGLVASKITVEGPIKDDKTSFLFSARRTYIDILAQPLIKLSTEGVSAGYFFYDFNFKLNHIFNANNRFYLSTYTGDDKAYSRQKDFYFDVNGRTDINEEFGLRWGNVITAARWNHVISPKLFSNLTATFSRYRFEVFDEYKMTSSLTPEQNEDFKSRYFSGIRDWALKADFDFLPNPDHYIRFGLSTIVHRFSPGVFYYRSSIVADTTAGASIANALEYSFYAEDDWRIDNRIKVNLGIHNSAFNVENKNYYSVQPRMALRFLAGKDFSIKTSYATMTQFIHLLTNAGIGLPTDLWVPSTSTVRPQQSWQVALGLAKTLKEYELSLEGYYKEMKNLIEYEDGANYLSIEEDWQDKVVTDGRGWSYGTEWLLQKKVGELTGWIGYTLSWTNRQFEELNSGRKFSYKFDNRHDVNIALSHTWDDKRDFSVVWVFSTGNAITLPTASYKGIEGAAQNLYNQYTTVSYFEGRNSFRMANYHRLDLSFSWWKDKKWGQRKWTIGIYNAYNRQNPFFVDIGYDKNGNKKFIQYSLFPIIPSFSYSFKFDRKAK